MSRGDVDAVAWRVVELLRNRASGSGAAGVGPELIDAATVAQLLGVSRATVYARADELGAIRIGIGPRARLRFDLARIVGTAPAQAGPEVRPRRDPTSGNGGRRQEGDLLPIRRGRTGSSGPLG